MEKATIETFHAQLTSADSTPLLEALRSLMSAEQTEIVSLFETQISGWTGWYY